MCGNPPAPIAAPNPADAENVRLQGAREAAERAEVERVRVQGQFDTSLEQALAGARVSGGQAIASRGLDEQEFLPTINNEITRIQGTIPNLAPAPGGFFAPDFGELALNNLRDARRTTSQNDINTFAPEGFALNRIPDTFDDDLISSIVEEQFGPASDILTNARVRGQVNDQGFNTALADLTGQRSAASSRVGDISGAVLESGRQGLRDTASTGRTNASSSTLANPFNSEGLRGSLDTSFGTFEEGFEGNVRAGIPTDLFDTSGAINRAGSAQGAQNVGSGTLFNVLASREKQRNSTRGLGTTGAF